MRQIVFILAILLSAVVEKAAAQDSLSVDTTKIVELESLVEKATKVTKLKEKRDWAKWTPSPKKATLLALIPGGGQIYNRKYWKLPIVYGGFVGCIYAWRWNGMMYSDYSRAYQDIMDDDPDTNSYLSFLHLGMQINESNIERYKIVFKNRKDRYRRWRDMSIFVTIGVYALSIIDAYVDASLSQFDISDDLTLRVSPCFVDGNSPYEMTASHSPFRNGGAGVRCSLSF